MDCVLVYIVFTLCYGHGIKYHSHSKVEFEKGKHTIKNIPSYAYDEAIKILTDYVWERD